MFCLISMLVVHALSLSMSCGVVGTGKTVAVVEAVLQVLLRHDRDTPVALSQMAATYSSSNSSPTSNPSNGHRGQNVRVLACAPSDAAAGQLRKRTYQ